FDKLKILDFLHDAYNPSNVVIGITGNYTLRKIERLIEKYFGDLGNTGTPLVRIPPDERRNETQIVKHPLQQTHTIIGGRAYSVKHKNRLELALLSNLLGGISMTSRLNLEVREKHGIAYNIESFY